MAFLHLQRFAWARARDPNGLHQNRPAHLFTVPLDDQRATACSERFNGQEWVEQAADDPTRHCGRCEEAERTYLAGRVRHTQMEDR